MEYRALGPLEVRNGEDSLPLGGAKQKALLALLLINANRVVSRDRLVDELWGENPPDRAVQTVQVYISRLRRVFPEGTLLTQAPGYLLVVGPDELDTERFERLLGDGRERFAAGEVAEASLVLRESLALWRGPAFAEFAYDLFAEAEIGRLEELRLVAVEERIDVDLALGRHDDLIGELEALIAQNPHRERPRGQLMLALYRCGRQAEALEAYREARHALVDELGIEPSAGLQQLERQILTHDEAIDAPPRVHPERPPAYRRPRVIVGGVATAAALIAFAVVVLGGSSGGASLRGLSANSVGLVDAATGEIRSDVGGVAAPTRVASGAGSIWVTSAANDTVSRIDADSRQLRQTIRVGDGPTGVAFGAGKVWVANSLDGTVSRIDPDANAVVGDPIRVGNQPTAVAFGDGAVWVTNADDESVSRIDPSTLGVRTFDVGAPGRGIATGAGSVWVTDGAANRLVRIDPATGDVTQTIGVGSGPGAVAVGNGAVWVANELDGTLSRIDPRTNAVRETIPVGASPGDLAAGPGAIWVADASGRRLVRVDPKSGEIAQVVQAGARPTGLALAGSLWVAAQASGRAHRGGTLAVEMLAPADESLDPAAAYDPTGWNLVSLTNDGLVGFRRSGGSEGTELVPDLAVSLPTPTDAGQTYRFQLRRGIRYSTGAPLEASDVPATFERLFQLASPRADYYANIVGARRCMRSPALCDLRRGIVANNRTGTVTFHLTRPDAEFLYKLAIPFADVLPGSFAHASANGCLTCLAGYPVNVNSTSTTASGLPATAKGVHLGHSLFPALLPVDGATKVPATGPYLSERDGDEHVRLVRNPYFRSWSNAARPDGYPDEIDVALNTPFRRAVADVERRRADLDVALPGSNVTQFASQHPAQVRTTPNLETFYVFLDTAARPFDKLQARRAVAFAIDRGALLAASGGAESAQPTCQVMPPSLPGYRPYCPFTRNVEKARALVRASGTRGDQVSFWFYSTPPAAKAERRVMRRLFTSLGYRASVRYFADANAYFRALAHGPGPQAGANAWAADYPAPSSSFAIVSCRMAENAVVNPGHFCSRKLEGEMDRALALQTRDRVAAARLWRKIDRDATDTAAIVPMYTPRSVDLVSKRVGNYQHHPLWGVLLDQLWVR